MSITITPQGDREIVITRVFNAPRHLVYEANTKPEFVKRWLGVRNGWILAVCEVDARVGGNYRFVWRNEAKGKEFGSRGTYLEVVAPERSVCTEVFDMYPDESIVTTTYVEKDGQTTLTLLLSYPTQEVRDMVLGTGMETGLGESYNVLDEILNELK